MHQIENSFLKIKAREYGAELTSIFHKKNNIEHLWQADPQFWGWHSPVLFPVVGRCLNDEIAINGHTFKMEKHGFARKSTFKLLELGENKMVFSLKSDEELLKIYPYEFEFLIGYRLEGNVLTVSYEVLNRDNKPISFSLGGHPAFAVPFLPDENYEDYHLEFEKSENESRHYIDGNGFFDGRKEVALYNSNTLQLKNNIFRDDAIIFKDLRSRKVTIRGKNNPYYLTMDFNGFNYLGLWAKTGAPYVCIEPWLGCADTANKPTDYRTKEGIIKLDPESAFTVSYTVEMG